MDKKNKVISGLKQWKAQLTECEGIPFRAYAST